ELARRHRIHLDTGALSPHLHVQADRVRLRQVLVNLLGNAIKYNRPDGEVRVRSQAHGDEVLIEVSDTGIGLSPAQQAHLFEPFNRLGAERTGVEGTGIGLVIVRRLIELMHGRMDVTSAPGQGSTFRLTLPLAEQRPLPSEHGAWLDLPAQPQSATILYAEDNEVNIMLVQQVLTLRPGWRLLVGTSGQRALELARRSPPDLMLIDMHLGDMTGFELADALDREPHLRNVPRVALSADAMPDRIHAARNRGFRAYLTKPLDVMALLRCLDEQLHRS
ncbi:MAG TPA: ATP-binding protein, partial [Aquabacterium sp.]|nr:ATP-binding protein [Aquabacterium sp.]